MDNLHRILNNLNESVISSNKDFKKTTKSYHEDIADPMMTSVPDIDGNDDSMLENTNEGDSMTEEYNESCDMVLSALKNIVSNINAILKNSDLQRVKENLTEPWVLGMIAVVEDNVSTVHDFVKFAGSSDDNQVEASKKSGLWDNIRKKKQREGKKYRPAKPGDKDRPDPRTWKELTESKICSKCGLATGCCMCGG